MCPSRTLMHNPTLRSIGLPRSTVSQWSGLVTLIALLSWSPGSPAGTVVWSGASGLNTNWSTAANWFGAVPPASGDDVKFYDAGTNLTPGLPSSLVDAGFAGTIGSLTLGNTNGFHTIVIAPGTTLSILNGNLSAGTPTDPLASRNLTNTITGAGSSLYVSNLTANLGINQADSTASPSRGNLDLSGLNNFIVSANRIGIGDGQFPGVSVNNRAGGNLLLAKTNFITLAYTDTLANYQTAGKSAAIVMSRNSGNNPGIISLLQLGLVNTFNVDSLNVGMDKSGNNSTPAHGVVNFNPAFAGQNPVAAFYGAGGPGTRVTWWSVGDGNQSASSSNGGGGTNDFSLGTINGFVNFMSLARDAGSSSDTWVGPHKGVFIFTNGTVDVNNLVVGNQSLETGTSTTPCWGILALNGAGAILKVNNNLTLGTNSLTTAAGTLTRGWLLVTNGTVLANNLTVGANSISNSINLANATLVVSNSLATNAAGLFSLNLSNSTLGLTLNANGLLRGLVKNFNTIGATNLLQLDPKPVIFPSYPTQVSLLRYTAWTGSNTFGLASVPPWAPGATIVSNGPNSTLDLYLPNDPRPVISSEPAGYSGSPGDPVTFSVGLNPTSVTPLGYQWFNGTTLLTDGATGTGASRSGSTSASLVINNAQPGDNGSYTVVITNLYGSVTSSPAAVLTISAGAIAPAITGPLPANQAALAGGTVTLTASVSGNPAPMLQWQLNGNNLSDGPTANGDTLSGSTGTALTVSNVQYPASQGTYSIIASNTAGLATNYVVLSVLVPPVITNQPVSLVVTNSQAAAFTVTAGGVPAPTYQWYLNNPGNPLAGATNATLALASTTPANTGLYFVIVHNAAGSVTSSNAALTVNSTMSAVALAPAPAATGICYDTPLYLTFNQPPVLRSAGKIRIYNVTNPATPVDTLDLSLTAANGTQARTPFPGDAQGFNYYPVVITGNQAAIYPHSGVLTSNQTYYVTVDDGAFADASGAYFAGIQGTSTWSFATKPGGPANPLNPVVAADGSGDFVTIQGAVDSIPLNNTTPTLITIHNGNYFEIINISSKQFVTFRGQSRTGTIVGYPNNVNIAAGGGTTHARMAFKVNAKNTAIENLTISNSTPQGGGQAEALMIESGASHFILNNAEVDSRQDTILANVNTSQGYFNNSLIQGNFDYIWGGGNLFFTNCEIRTITGVTTPNLTAARTDNGPTGNWPGYLSLLVSNGFSFVNCQLTRSTNTVTNCTMSDNNGSTNGNAVWINCGIDTGCYVNATATAQASQLLWELGNTNLAGTLLDNTGVPFASFSQLTLTDPRYLAASSATNWLNGWVPQLAPNILTQPTNQTVQAGQTATFTVAATGIPNAGYQWLQNGTNAPYASANSATLTIPNAQAADASNLSVLVTNAAGSVASTTVSLTVTTPTPPTLGSIAASSTIGVQFSISGTAGFGYRVWGTTNLNLTPVVTTWTLLGSGTFPASPVNFSDPQSTNYVQRFYTVTVP